MASIKTWITLSRIHTAALTVPGTLLGLQVSGNHDVWTYVFLALWALAFHGFGFLCNSAFDRDFDAKDPGKVDFPLVTGAIKIGKAWMVLIVGVVASIAFGMYLSLGRPMGAVAMLVAILGGFGYNALSKHHWTAPFFMCASFAALPAFGYYVGGGTGFPGRLLFLSAYGACMMFHSAVIGYVKDLGSDPVSWLRSMGASATTTIDRSLVATRLRPSRYRLLLMNEGAVVQLGHGVYHYVFPTRTWFFGLASRSLIMVPILVWMPPPHGWLSFVVAALAGLLMIATGRLFESGVWSRTSRIRLMGMGEVLAYFILVFVMEPILGEWVIVYLVAPFAYYLIANRILWGRGYALAPRV